MTDRITELEAELAAARDRAEGAEAARDRLFRSRDIQAARAKTAAARVTELETEVARYRTAWKSAAFRASAYSEGIFRLCDDRNAYKGWMEQEQAHSAGLRAEVARLTAGQDHTCPDGQPCPGHDEPATA